MRESLIPKLAPATASLKLTLLGLALLGVGAWLVQAGAHGAVYWLVAALLLLAWNLICAIAVDRRFRARGALLGFHVCLLVLVLLLAVGYLTRLKGTVELVEGQAFAPELVEVFQQGPWHPWALAKETFEQGPITVNYSPGVVRQRTHSEVWIQDDAGERSLVEVEEGAPLVVQGYRFYTTSNKGYSIALRWEAEDGSSTLGAVNLPSYPLMASEQRNSWRTPGGEELELGIELQGVAETESWVLRSEGVEAELRVALGEEVRELKPGEVLPLRGGHLRFEGLRMWMGYLVYYDPTLPYLFAAALGAVLLMALHFRAALWMQPISGQEKS